MNHILSSLVLVALVAAFAAASSPAIAELAPVGAWKDHTIYQFNGLNRPAKQAAKVRMLSENWDGMTELAYMAYMPDKHRVILHFRRRNGSDPGTYLIESDDFGNTWSKPRFMQTDAAGSSIAPASTGLTYLGNGKLVATSEQIGFSSDYGKTWGDWMQMPGGVDGKPMYQWDPLLADIDPKTGDLVRLADTRYKEIGTYGVPGYTCQSCIRFSTDGGKTWGKEIEPPQWRDCNECVLVRAKNGDIVAVLRPNFRGRYAQLWHDNYCGLAVSISKDNGYTWSERQVLFDWGRMHSSPVLLPNGDLVITYLVRRGYPNTPDGNWPQYGVEGIVSHDNGKTWDIDHRYMIFEWTGPVSSRDIYLDMATGCNVSTVVAPDSTLLTVVGAGPRLDPTRKDTTIRDDFIIKWKLSPKAVGGPHQLASAPVDSDIRNRININKFIKATPPAAKKNIALLTEGAKVTSSPGMRDYYGPGPISPEFLLHDPYVYPAITRFSDMPAWIEVRWARAKRIDQIDIYPGDPSKASSASTEMVPLDYQLQYEKDGKWVDIVAVKDAPRYSDYLKTNKRLDLFKYEHKFPTVTTKAVRMNITRTSNPDGVNTILRMFEVYQAK